ncbi:MAG: UDP-N-acetylmuramoyl-tripeptide--D-alanyl-D-alanine ligase [Zoogloeaceae bacterium]|jgi:UDP-N-acetylmuramoyl-tripeptide--D-alanyl-D-alanine ligase|nr:UDP-N-acetylmuramoyl-tripeptide--D-alanyl-D-alanine ligase [Zoogloeaceae bacterium]
MHWNLSGINDAVSGTLQGEDREIFGIATDSRADCKGALFIALKGDNFDGHDYLAQAAAQGAAACLVERGTTVPETLPAIFVYDTNVALGKLAFAWRSKFNLPLIAITGSNGKTTTKEMIRAILEAAFGESAVLATQGNFNNAVGLPLTLLRLKPAHLAAVVEMGMNHPGEIGYLTRITAPTAALVTNAQRAHLAGLADVAAVAREKGDIYGGLAERGVALINDDDDYAPLWRSINVRHPIVGFGFQHGSTIAGQVSLNENGSILALRTPLGGCRITLSVPGLHNAQDALAAASAAWAIGVDLETIAAGLAAFTGVKGRLQRLMTPEGTLLFDDTYNANPDSVRAGLTVLADQPQAQKIFVFGDMGEIGVSTRQRHAEVGKFAKNARISRLFCLGESARETASAFGHGGAHFDDIDALIAALRPLLNPDTAVLVKGSRFMKMERVVAALAPKGN